MAAFSGRFLLESVVVIIAVVHIIYCPFTKVEESFNLQATHDILYHGFDVAKYDHLEFPGVVPRSFVGPLFLSLLSSPFVTILKLLSASKIYSQYVVRLCLGLCTVFSFIAFKRAVSKKFGSNVGNFLILLTVSQFHILFYSSRPLPNTFALCLVLLSACYWLLKKHASFIWVSAFAIIIFRTELSILLGLMLLIDLCTGRLSLTKTVIHSCLAGITGLGLTVGIDSIFWQRYIWPEGEVFYFNAVLNKSSQWGTFPFLWYFYSVLPRALLFGLVLIPIGIWHEKKTWSLVFPSLVFVCMFSFLPHKELRFIVYVFPVFNTAAACGLNHIYQYHTKWKSWLSWVTVLCVMAGLICSCLATSFFMYISHNNYPGGVALSRLHQLVDHKRPVHVHISAAAAEMGVSRFGELNSSWRYSKQEGLKQGSSEMFQFTHLIAEAPCDTYKTTHTVLEQVQGYTGISLDVHNIPFIVKIHMDARLCILQRNKDLQSPTKIPGQIPPYHH